jgi:hypothetical protein
VAFADPLIPSGAENQAPGPTVPFVDTNKAQARIEFDRGIARFQNGDWETALVAFRRSLTLFPTTAALINASLCLRRLGRIEEALETLESWPRLFGPISQEDKAAYEAAIAELSKEIGWVEIRNVEPSSNTLIDGREVAVSGSPNRLSAGAHRIKVESNHQPPVEHTFTITAGETKVLTFPFDVETAAQAKAKDTDLSPALSSARARWSVGVEGAISFSNLGGDVASCSGCGARLAWGGNVMVRLAYRLDDRWAVGLQGGYIALSRSITNRATSVISANGADAGQASDALLLSGALAGAGAEYQVMHPIDMTVRAGAGALLGGLRDERAGQFVNSVPGVGDAKYPVDVSQRATAVYGFLSFGADLGYRVTGRLRLSAGLDVKLLVAFEEPAWDPDAAFQVEGARESSFERETFSGRSMVIFGPFAGARYDF